MEAKTAVGAAAERAATGVAAARMALTRGGSAAAAGSVAVAWVAADGAGAAAAKAAARMAAARGVARAARVARAVNAEGPTNLMKEAAEVISAHQGSHQPYEGGTQRSSALIRGTIRRPSGYQQERQSEVIRASREGHQDYIRIGSIWRLPGGCGGAHGGGCVGGGGGGGSGGGDGGGGSG